MGRLEGMKDEKSQHMIVGAWMVGKVKCGRHCMSRSESRDQQYPYASHANSKVLRIARKSWLSHSEEQRKMSGGWKEQEG